MVNELVAVYNENIRALIEHRRAGNNNAAYSIQERIILKSGCELWELIEAEEVVNNAKFGGADWREVAKTKPAKAEWGKPLGQAADNNVEGQILAKQERDNADAYL